MNSDFTTVKNAIVAFACCDLLLQCLLFPQGGEGFVVLDPGLCQALTISRYQKMENSTCLIVLGARLQCTGFQLSQA